jgi:3',5'-cyclic AMP phosphodiesterase CpdA
MLTRRVQKPGVHMPDNELLSVLHISDFHFTSRRRHDQQVVVDALIKDLETLCIGHRRPDIVMFTGDLVQAAGVDTHDEAFDFLLDRVKSATGCGDERMFIVAGNHDVSRPAVQRHRDDHVAWREKCASQEFLNEEYSKNTFSTAIRDKFKDFLYLEEYLSAPNRVYRNDFAILYCVKALNIEVIVLNSSVFSAGGIAEFGSDSGKLAIPEHALLDLIKHLTPGAFRIFTAHHPFRMLAEDCARSLESLIAEHAHIHLFGHMHDPNPTSVVRVQGNVFYNQAGAVFTHRQQGYIGYALISIDRTTNYYETHLRTYFNDRRCFDEARDVADRGRFYSSQAAREFWRTIATPIGDDQLRQYLSGAGAASLALEMQGGAGDRSVHEMFVAPPLRRAVPVEAPETSTTSSKDTYVKFDDLIEGKQNYVIIGAPEFGRTTILKEIRYRLTSHSALLAIPLVPVFVDFSDIKSNSEQVLRVVRARSYELPEGITIESLLKLGRACILIDDVVFSDKRRAAALREFVSEYPKARYIFSMPRNMADVSGIQVRPEMPIHFETVEVCEFRRRDMRQLITKFGGSADVDTILDRLQTEFKGINIPFTAANGSIMMEIYQEKSGFKPINRAVLIEQFIDTTLSKVALDQIERQTFDYSNKTALLSHISAWMAQKNDYKPFEQALVSEISSYLNSIGLRAPISDLMTEFFMSKIFIKHYDSRVSFRYRAVLEYFIAHRMRDDGAFKDWVMEEERYLQFINEIQYYAGSRRNDVNLVEDVGRRFSQLLAEIAENHAIQDVNQLANLKLPNTDQGLVIDELNQQLFQKPLTQEERDEELQPDLPQDVQNRQEVFRPEVRSDAQKFLLSLILYSGCLKNMELIPDAEKRRHLATIWQGWSTFLLLSLSIVAELARRRRIRINGILYEVLAPQSMPAVDLARAISLQMPLGVCQLISAVLGTEKLERQLAEVAIDNAEPLIYKFLRASLIADLRLTATPVAIRQVLTDLKDSPYLREAMAMKVADLRRLDRLVQSHFDEIAPSLAQAIADLKGGSFEAREEEKRRQLQIIKRNGLLLRMRRHTESD